MKIAPGPPQHLYGGKVIHITEDSTIDVDLRLRHIGTNALGDQDYGLGVRRIDGWLVIRVRIHLASVYTNPTPEAIARLLPTDRVTVRTHRPRPGPGNGTIPAHVWAYGEEKSVNYLLGGVMSSSDAGRILR